MKHFFFLFLIVLLTRLSFGQQQYVDSLNQQLNNSKDDTSRVLTLNALAVYYAFNHFDTATLYAQQMIDLSKKVNYSFGHHLGLRSLFYAYNAQGNYAKALAVTLENSKIAETFKKERPYYYAGIPYFFGVLNREMENYPIAIAHFEKAIRMNADAGLREADIFPAFCQLALVYQKLKRLDSALLYAQKGYDLSLIPNVWSRFVCLSAAVLGLIHTELRNYDLARNYFMVGIQQSKLVNNGFFLAWNYNLFANLFARTNAPDSCIYYAKKSFQLWGEHNFGVFAMNASSLLARVYELQKKPDSAIKYMKVMIATRDTVFNQQRIQEFERSVFEEEQKKQQIQKEQEQYKNRIRTYALFSGIVALLLIAFILWRNIRQKQKAKTKIEKAYAELKSTQAQLIQSEKMASLGELTAGIAHEIQNPLNFVNNFSEVSNEMIEEMDIELNKGDTQEAKVIAAEIKQNLEKINHHGKRADAIVKSMLQHSRTNTGKKEPTDINALTGEYLRLAYHGMRAKDKSFNATMKTEFDESIGKVNSIPQEIGRVVLNLINNAFYAVDEKKKQTGNEYDPTVSISTKKEKDKVEIKVKDNGNGIPQKVLDKIFQPFFTTKPTGQGTGLGLSLAYDIVKAHGGELRVITNEGEGSEFIVQIPVNH